MFRRRFAVPASLMCWFPLFTLTRFKVQFIDDMQQCLVREGIGPRLCVVLGIDGMLYVVKLIEQVYNVELEVLIAFEETF